MSRWTETPDPTGATMADLEEAAIELIALIAGAAFVIGVEPDELLGETGTADND